MLSLIDVMLNMAAMEYKQKEKKTILIETSSKPCTSDSDITQLFNYR